MSKPMTRVVLSMVVGLAILVGMYTVAYGAPLRAGATGGGHSIKTYYYADFDQHLRVHDCNFDSGFDPDD